MKIEVGTFGKMGTFGQSYKATSRYVLVVGFCPAKTSVYDVKLLLAPDEWSVIQEVSKVDRYIVLTPRLTSTGYLSQTNQKLAMAPIAGVLENNWEGMGKDEWLNHVASLNKTSDILAIATESAWTW